MARIIRDGYQDFRQVSSAQPVLECRFSGIKAPGIIMDSTEVGVSLNIENYCMLRLFYDLSTLAGLSRRNLPEAGIRLLFQI